ncbi:hypothetical protein D3C72_1521670 [compost metagenome]
MDGPHGGTGRDRDYRRADFHDELQPPLLRGGPFVFRVGPGDPRGQWPGDRRAGQDQRVAGKRRYSVSPGPCAV